MVSVVACVAVMHFVVWTAFTIVERTRWTRRAAAVTELLARSRHRHKRVR